MGAAGTANLRGLTEEENRLHLFISNKFPDVTHSCFHGWLCSYECTMSMVALRATSRSTGQSNDGNGSMIAEYMHACMLVLTSTKEALINTGPVSGLDTNKCLPTTAWGEQFILCKLKFGLIVHPSHTLDSLKPSFTTLQYDYPHLELYQGSVSHQGPPLSHHQHTPGSACSVPAEHIVHTALPATKLKSIELS